MQYQRYVDEMYRDMNSVETPDFHHLDIKSSSKGMFKTKCTKQDALAGSIDE